MKMPRRSPDDIVNGNIRLWYLEKRIASLTGVFEMRFNDGELTYIDDGEIYYRDKHDNVFYFSPITSEKYYQWKARYERHLNHLILS